MAIDDMQKAISAYQSKVEAVTLEWERGIAEAEAEFIAAVTVSRSAGDTVPPPGQVSPAVVTRPAPVEKLDIPPGKMLMDVAVYEDVLKKLEKVDQLAAAHPGLFAGVYSS